MVYSQEQYTLVGDLARQAGVSKDTIRLYERMGFIRSKPISAGSREYRLYPTNATEDIRKIKIAQQAGLRLADIRPLFEAWTTHSPATQKRILQTRISIIDDQITRLVQFKASLDKRLHTPPS